MVSQFISPDKVGLLGDIPFDFPEGSHAIGRLDNESEGLLIVTTNKKVTRLLFKQNRFHHRTYLVMVQNVVTSRTLDQLKAGITIRVKGGEDHITVPEEVKIITEPQKLYSFASDPREQYPHTWLLISITEGKFHQVRKMVLAVKHRCLRLIRLSICNLNLENLPPGQVLEMEENIFFTRLGISSYK